MDGAVGQSVAAVLSSLFKVVEQQTSAFTADPILFQLSEIDGHLLKYYQSENR